MFGRTDLDLQQFCIFFLKIFLELSRNKRNTLILKILKISEKSDGEIIAK